jgi:hypothetical protein
VTTPEITNVHVSDYREVDARVSGMPPLYTAKGNRPLDPRSISIRYRIGTDRVYITIGGQKLFKESGMRGLDQHASTYSRRSFFATDDVLPPWVHELIEQHRPAVSDSGWWK